MPNYEITDDGLFLTENGGWSCLVSFWDFYGNLGALPLRPTSPEAPRTLPVVLRELGEKYGGDTLSVVAAAAVFLQAQRGYRPLLMLQAAESRPELGSLLVEAGREAHPLSRVFTFADAGCRFDLIICEGEGKQLARLLSPGGDMLRLTGGTGFSFFNPQKRIRELKASLKTLLPDLRACIKTLAEMESLSLYTFDLNDINFKQRINEAKEDALNCLYTPSEAFRQNRMERLKKFISGGE
jgi:hypothetical protein